MTGTTSGTCFGFDVRSDVPLRYLREGTGSAVLRITADADQHEDASEPLLDWGAARETVLDARLHLGERGRYRLWIDGPGGGWFTVDPADAHIRVPPDADPLRREERIWGIPIALCLLERTFLPLHAACIEVNGRALAVGGPTHAGKTTLAGALVAAGARLLSEDLTVLDLRTDTPVTVVPGPAMLRMRRDMVAPLGLGPAHGVDEVGADGDRVHFSVTPGRRGTGDAVPLDAIVLLREGDEFDWSRTDGVTVLPDLWSLSFHLPLDDARAACFRRLADVASSVPIFEFRRPLRLDALGRAVATVMSHLGSA